MNWPSRVGTGLLGLGVLLLLIAPPLYSQIVFALLIGWCARGAIDAKIWMRQVDRYREILGSHRPRE